MKTKIEVLGDITDGEFAWLEVTVREHGWQGFVPGDGVVIAQHEGQPPKIAYLNRRIHVNANGVKYKLIFEVGAPSQRQVEEIEIDQQDLFNKLREFAIRKSAAFNRPDTAARELVNFFTTYIQGE